MRRLVAGFFCLAGVVATTPFVTASAAPTPNITGVWEGMWSAPSEFANVDPKLLPPTPGTPQYKPEYQAQYAAILSARTQLLADNRVAPTSQVAELETTCLPYGMPTTMMGFYELEILQTPGQVTVLAGNEIRRIYLNKSQLPIEAVAPGYWGRSVGRWAGDTLVVDTVGVKPKVIGTHRAPLVHSDQMRITERLRLVAPQLLRDEITVTDPVALERPYTSAYLMKRVRDYEIPEYVCDNIRESVNEKGEITMKLPQKP